MTTRRSSPPTAPETTLPAPAEGPIAAWKRFWLTPTDPRAMSVLRVLTGILLITWLLAFYRDIDAFFGLQGWFDREAYTQSQKLGADIPAPISWSVVYLCGTNTAALHAVYWGSLGVLLLFTLGIATRITGALTWVIVASFIANPATTYDADYLLAILAFYLGLGYLLLGQWSGQLSFLGRLFGPKDAFVLSCCLPRQGECSPRETSFAANLTMRLIQVHFAIIVFVSGLHKLQIGDWWSGVAFWYPLHPPMETTAASIKAEVANATSYLTWLSLIQYAVLAWQLAFPFFAWRPRWRWLLVGGAVIGWIGSVAITGLPLFGPIYLIGALSYITSEEWERVEAFLGRLRRVLRPERDGTETARSAPTRVASGH